MIGAGSSGISQLSGAERSRDRVRLLREGLGGRRQLALHERQRDVLGLPLASHQHLARADGLRDVSDARRLPRLPEPLPDRQVLRRLRRPLRLPRPHPLPHRGDERRAGRRRRLRGELARRRRAARAPITTPPCSSPTGTTGTRAGPSRRSRARRSSRASRSTSTTTRRPRSSATSGCWSSGIGNSATDLAVEASRVGETTFLAMRRSAHIVPKYVLGKPTDETAKPWVTSRCRCACSGRSAPAMLRMTHGKVTDYGLPEPDHKLYEAHPDRLLGPAATDRSRRRQGEAEHRALRRRAHGALRRRHARRRSTSSSTARATRSPSRSSTRTSSRRATTGCRSTAGSSIPSIRASTSSACCSRWGRSCRSPRRSRSGSATCSRARRSCPAPGAMRSVIAREDERMARRYVSLEAAHDPGRLLPLYAHARTRARRRRRTPPDRRAGSPLARARAPARGTRP